MLRLAERIGRSLDRSGLIAPIVSVTRRMWSRTSAGKWRFSWPYSGYAVQEQSRASVVLLTRSRVLLVRGRSGISAVLVEFDACEAEKLGYHGVFASARPDRARIVPGTRTTASAARGEGPVGERCRPMSMAQRLRRVFAIDIQTCRQRGGHLRVIASMEDPAVIERIVEHPFSMHVPGTDIGRTEATDDQYSYTGARPTQVITAQSGRIEWPARFRFLS